MYPRKTNQAAQGGLVSGRGTRLMLEEDRQAVKWQLKEQEVGGFESDFQSNLKFSGLGNW